MESLKQVDNEIGRLLDQVQNRLSALEKQGKSSASSINSTTPSVSTIVKKERKMNDYDEDELDPNLAFEGLQYNEDDFADRRRKQTKNVGIVVRETKQDFGNLNFFDGAATIRLKQDASEGCGGYLWSSAVVLLHYLENKTVFPSGFWKGKSVIELGAGTGIVGMALAKLGARVVLTDLDAMIPLMHANLVLNSLENQVKLQNLFWGKKEDHDALRNEKFDFILASDCVYLEAAFEPLIETLIELNSHSPNVLTLMSFQTRRKADKRFWKKAQKKFTATTVDKSLYSRTSDVTQEPVEIREVRIKK